MERRVVITGMGIWSCIGMTLDEVCQSLFEGRSGIVFSQERKDAGFRSFFLKSPMHDYTQGEEAVNHLYQQHTMLKNAIREMGGYEADEELD